MTHPRFRKPAFVTWPKHRQREAWTRLRNDIRQGVKEGRSPLFESRHVEEDDPHPLALQWADIFLLGQDRRTIWNVTLSTGRRLVWDEVKDKAREAARAKLSADDEAVEDADWMMGPGCFIKLPKEGKSKVAMYQWNPGEPPRHPSLGGRTLREAQKDEERRIIVEDRPVVHEGWTLHRDYRYGIGVHAVVETEQFTRAALERWVGQFREFEGRAWRAEHPITRFLPGAIAEDMIEEGSLGWIDSQQLRMD
jgi:hypothetical protein